MNTKDKNDNQRDCFSISNSFEISGDFVWAVLQSFFCILCFCSFRRCMTMCETWLPFNEIVAVGDRVNKECSGYVVYSCLLATLRILLNISHDNGLLLIVFPRHDRQGYCSSFLSLEGHSEQIISYCRITRSNRINDLDILTPKRIDRPYEKEPGYHFNIYI